MNNLKKFNTESEYQQASLNYPAVSWVTATDNVHFDKSGSTPTVNDKVMMAWHSPSGVESGKDIALWNAGSSITPTDYFDSLTLNDVDVMGIILANGILENYSTPDTDYLVKYELIADTTITDIFSGDLGGGWGSSASNVDFLIPSQVTQVDDFPTNVGNLVIEATTPPTFSMGSSGHETLENIYIPTESVSAYQSTWGSTLSSVNYLPISDYSGNLPV